MKDFEKLVAEIMADALADGEPVTKEEAEEMARMELGAKADRRYEKAEHKAPRKPKERKVDLEKLELLQVCENALRECVDGEPERKTETELHFVYKGSDYSLKLIRHRPPKN